MLALAEYGSFCRAAEAMNITQPAFSRSVQSLEDALGVQLFDRTSRQIKLTPIGLRSVDAARDILKSAAEFHRVIDHTRSCEVGEIRIGLGNVTSGLFGAPIMRGYAERLPMMRLLLIVGAPECLYEQLRTEQIDLVVGNTEATRSQGGLELEEYGQFERGFFCRTGHPLAEATSVTIDDLMAYPVGATYPLPDIVQHTIKHTYAFSSNDAFFRLESNHYGAFIDLMSNSDTIVFGSKIAYLLQFKRGEVIQLPVTPMFPYGMTLTVARLPGRVPSQASQLVSEIIREQLAA